MPTLVANLEEEYSKDKELKRDDVKSLKEWADKQAHLPKLSELQVVLFLQSCYYSNEQAKTTIDTFFTVRTLFPEVFTNRNPLSESAKAFMDVALVAPLPNLTPEGYKVILLRFRDFDPEKYIFTEQLKYFDMVSMLCLHQEGTQKGQILLVDQTGVVFGHLTKLGIMPMKKFLYYLQEAMPVRLKGLHFINIVPFIDKLMALMKPFLKKELMDVLHLHPKTDGVFKFIPQKILPKEYGGEAPSIEDLHRIHTQNLRDNVEYFLTEEKQLVDQSKRSGTPKSVNDVFGIDGTFKKLDID